MLEAAAFLGVLNEADIEWLVANSEESNLPAGSILIRRHEPVDHLYLIVNGAFEITVAMPEERHIATLYAGELVGEMSFVDLHPPSATVVAGADSTVLAVTKASVTEKIKNDAGFAARFFKGVAVLLAGRLRAAYAVDLNVPEGRRRKIEMDLLTRRFEAVQHHLGLRRFAKGI